QQSDLQAVLEEDVAERRREDRLEAVVLQAPRGVLARGAAAEVPARDQDLRAGVLRPVQLEGRILAPVPEDELAVTRPLDPEQELLRHDLVGVDVRAVEDGDAAFDAADGLHAGRSWC